MGGGWRVSIKSFRDQEEKVRGSARDGFYEVGEYNCIEITECHEADCLKDEE